ncbi:glycosyltransferase family 9 protein [Aerophototrophica crusticola]|uniref:Glycosyltransferase family 9 protein n=1 Tax=Aerophototrophica crusticola TaxID=1709002 RepID=A0A858R4Z4_9PROT|nr:glycosyltransferase family 9 protein [Rhodospirillaceae bacterium B3]
MDVLFITSNRLGDAVLTTGLLGHLVDTLPAARFTVACGPIPAPLFRTVPRLARLIPLRKRRWSGHWLELWAQVVGTRWDLVVDLRDSAVSRLIPARRRAIFRNRKLGLHKVAELAGVLGVDPPPSPRLWLDAETQREAAARLGPGNFLALGPAANWTGKEWPAERYADLAERLTAPGTPLAGARVVVLAGPGEEQRCRPVLDRLGDRAINLVGRTDPLLAGACVARARLFVGNDSGLMHVAAAVGTPTLGVFGPTPVETYGPWGEHCRYVLAPRVEGDTPEDRMRRITVEEVEQAALGLLARTPELAAW